MKFKLHPYAEIELYEAIDYCEHAEPGLGRDFAEEIYSTIQRILLMPKAWPIIEDDIRRALVRRFPMQNFVYRNRK